MRTSGSPPGTWAGKRAGASPRQAAADIRTPGNNMNWRPIVRNAKLHTNRVCMNPGSTAIAMWHQDRRSNGGARGIGVGYSTDGGASWTETPIALTACSAPATPQALSNMFRASDPWVSIGPDGIAYASALSFNLTVPNNANAVAAARSTDDGKTW